MLFEPYIGIRYLLSKKNQKLLSLITWISILGVVVGVMALCVVISGFSGFQESFREKILGNNAPLILFRFSDDIEDYQALVETIESVEGVKAAAPFVYSEVLAQSETGRSAGIVVYGVDPKKIIKVTDLEKDMIDGHVLDLESTNEQPLQYPKMILGKDLADSELIAFRGMFVDLVSPKGDVTPFGLGPRVKRFEVGGLFQSGMYEYDSKSAYINLTEAQKFFGKLGKVKGVQISVDDADDAYDVAKSIQAKVGSDYYVRHWMELNQDLFAAFQTEKKLSFIVLAMIILVASFNIIGTLTLLVMTKSKEIAILKAMGATKWSIQKIFMISGTVIGLIGTFFGILSGLIVCYLLKYHFQFKLNAGVYQMDHLPIIIDPIEVLLIGCCALLICFVATIYPAYRAASIEPSEGLRYE
ncbi:MAG: ABC transporter permease [Bdellovibrionales bacterium]|nr:ABC transporter permease [Bdellovibrionales bacterium]